MEEMEKGRERKIIKEGNAFYEIDLNCIEKRRKCREEMEKKRGSRQAAEEKNRSAASGGLSVKRSAQQQTRF